MTDVHVLPLGDLIDHEVPGGYDRDHCGKGWLIIEADSAAPDEPCPCTPAVEHIPGEAGGPDGWLVTHHSLDGREIHE